MIVLTGAPVLKALSYSPMDAHVWTCMSAASHEHVNNNVASMMVDMSATVTRATSYLVIDTHARVSKA